MIVFYRCDKSRIGDKALAVYCMCKRKDEKSALTVYVKAKFLSFICLFPYFLNNYHK